MGILSGSYWNSRYWNKERFKVGKYRISEDQGKDAYVVRIAGRAPEYLSFSEWSLDAVRAELLRRIAEEEKRGA